MKAITINSKSERKAAIRQRADSLKAYISANTFSLPQGQSTLKKNITMAPKI